jgi:hypothetical protein
MNNPRRAAAPFPVETIKDPPSDYGSEGTLALVVRAGGPFPHGVNFITDPAAPVQLGLIAHPRGRQVERHLHPAHARTVSHTTEILVIKTGTVLVYFYNSRKDRVAGRHLYTGDVLIHLAGGHEFQVLDDCEIIEVRPGPYDPLQDKVKF